MAVLDWEEACRGQYSRRMLVSLDNSSSGRKRQAFELVVVVGKSYYTGRCVEELQKGGTAWRGLGSNGAHACNGEVREGGTLTDRQ